MTMADKTEVRTFGRRGVTDKAASQKPQKSLLSPRAPTMADIPPASPEDDDLTGTWSEGRAAYGHAVTPVLVEFFVGPNAYKYLATYARMKAKDPDLRRLVAGWCWPVFFVPLPWLLYRKQWGLAALLVILPIVVAYLFPTLTVAPFAVGVAFAVLAKSLYIRSAATKIRAIAATEDNPDLLRARVMRAGGISMPGAIIGTIIMLVGVVAQIVVTAGEIAAVRAGQM